MKKPAVRVLFMYFVALAVFESVAGIKERKKLKITESNTKRKSHALKIITGKSSTKIKVPD